MKQVFVFLTGLLFLAGCGTTDWTKGQSNICPVHHVVMSKRKVPTAYGMIPMSRAEAERGQWKSRTEYYPNAGDCLPATDVNLTGQQRALVYVCQRCEVAMKELEKPLPRLDTEVLAVIQSELARLSQQALHETGPMPRPSSQAAFYLLTGLAAQSRQLEALPESEQRLFGVETRGGSRGKVLAVAEDVRIALIDSWIQDKAGTYLLKTAALYIRQKSAWIRKADAQIAVGD